MTQEVWEKVRDYPRFEISNFGNVRRLYNRQGVTRPVTLRDNSSGYLTVSMSGRTWTVHALVMRAFVGERPSEMVINHKDANKHNNCLSNLEYVTKKENSRHAWDHGLVPSGRHKGESHANAVLTSNDVREIRMLLQEGTSQQKIAERYGVCRGTVYAISKNKLWRHLDNQEGDELNMTNHMTGNGLITWLRTPLATLVVLVAALLAQLPHAADVFRLLVHGEGWYAIAHSYSYAIALELAVLLFVVQRRNVESYIFAIVSVCVNLAYYALHGVNLFTYQAAPAWLISIALPAAIAQYSHLIVDAAHDAPVRTSNDAAWKLTLRRMAFWRKHVTPVTPVTLEDVTPEPESVTVDDATPAKPKRKAKPKAQKSNAGVTELARKLGVSRTTVYRKLNSGELQLNGTGD